MAAHTHASLSNSNLKLAAIFLGALLKAQHDCAVHPNNILASDNITVVAWTNHSFTTTNQATTYLLHALAQRHHAKPFDLKACYTPRNTNQVADCCFLFLPVLSHRYRFFGLHQHPLSCTALLATCNTSK
jgi:hypothetical protein